MYAAADSHWNSCISATNDDMSSCDYPISYRNAPYLPNAMGKATQMMPPSLDYRWDLIHASLVIGNQCNSRSSPQSPVYGNQGHGRPPTMGKGRNAQILRPCAWESPDTTTVGGAKDRGEVRGVKQVYGASRVGGHSTHEGCDRRNPTRVKRQRPDKEKSFLHLPPVRGAGLMPPPPVHGMLKAERSQPSNARGVERAIRPFSPIQGPKTASLSAASIPYTK